jgi:hypothetical protein
MHTQAFSKYDNDNNGTMEFADLKMMLTDLNGGVAPDDDEVQVLEHRAISRMSYINPAITTLHDACCDHCHRCVVTNEPVMTYIFSGSSC